MCSRERFSVFLLAFFFLAFFVPSIILFSLYPYQKHLNETFYQGYIVPGGDCQISCSSLFTLGECRTAGFINVSFYPFGGLESNQSISVLTNVPSICDFENVDATICCQDYIEEETLFWLKVEFKDGNYTINSISFNKINDTIKYLFLGSLFLVISLIPGIGLGCFVKNELLAKCQTSQTFYIQLG